MLSSHSFVIYQHSERGSIVRHYMLRLCGVMKYTLILGVNYNFQPFNSLRSAYQYCVLQCTKFGVRMYNSV